MNDDLIAFLLIVGPAFVLMIYGLWRISAHFKKEYGYFSKGMVIFSVFGVIGSAAIFANIGHHIAQTNKTEAVYEFVIDGYATGTKNRTYAILKETTTGLTSRVRLQCVSGLGVGDFLQLRGVIHDYKGERTMNVTHMRC